MLNVHRGVVFLARLNILYLCREVSLTSLLDTLRLDMFETFLNGIFGNSENQAKKCTSPPKGRRLGIEALESREMLSISALEPDFGLANVAPFPYESSSADLVADKDSNQENFAVQAAAPAGYNAHDWQKVDSQNLHDYAEWTEIDGEQRLTGIDANWYGSLSGILDLSGCSRLISVKIPDNEITEIKLDGCTALEELDCYSNQLTGTLDVSGLMNLRSLFCDANYLTGIKFNGCTALEKLDCSGNQLTGTLDVSGFASLRWLFCGLNQLTEIKLDGCSALEYFRCYENQLTGMLDFSEFANLRFLSCFSNQLTEIKLNGCIALEFLECGNNQLIGYLNVLGLVNLQELYCYSNQLKFSTLPIRESLPALQSSRYDSQALIAIGNSLPVEAGETIDLSSEYRIDGAVTTFTWYYANGEVVPTSRYSASGGRFAFTGLANGDAVYCVMTNPKFPGLTLQTTSVKIQVLYTDNVGDTRSTAREIVFNNNAYTFTDKLGEGEFGLKDVDMYKFVVSSADVGKTYTFTTSLPIGGATVDTYMRLFNATSVGTTEHLAFNDDISGSSNRYSKITWIPTAAGTYYVGVSSYGNRAYNPNVAGSSAGNGTKGDYVLTVTK